MENSMENLVIIVLVCITLLLSMAFLGNWLQHSGERKAERNAKEYADMVRYENELEKDSKYHITHHR